jgi:hypothetical protein
MTDASLPTRPDHATVALWVTLGLLFAALTGAAFYKTWPLLYPEVLASAPLDPACNLNAGPCTARFPDGAEVRFGLEPRTLPPVAPLRIGVEIGGVEARSVEVDFAGTDMNMGYNRLPLTEIETGRYEGQGMLPVCVRNRMEWEAKVMLHTAAGILVAPFRFETVSAR